MEFDEFEERIVRRTLQNVVDACLYSGSRGRGIVSVERDNRSFLLLLQEKPEQIRESYPCSWMKEIVEENALFIGNFLDALRPIFPSAGSRGFETTDGPKEQKDCLCQVFHVCDRLADLMMKNRSLKKFIMAHPEAIEPWTQNWLEDFDIFIMDIWQALALPEPPEGSLRPWPGDQWEHESILMTVKSRRVLQALWRNPPGRKEEKSQHHAAEAR